METLTLDVPAMYGDHHVLEVRRILLELPGVEDVNASSSFHVVEVHYDPEKVNADELKDRLDEAGYLGELLTPEETGLAVHGGRANGNAVHFRHTATYQQTRQAISFARTPSYSGRPLWPCPGIGVISASDEEK